VTTPRLADLQLLVPEARSRVSWLLVALRAEGVPLEVFETARPPARQAYLYQIGRDPDSPTFGRTVTHAMPWQSAHQWGFAADLVFKVAGRWTWKEPEHGMWDRLTDLAKKADLRTLSFERPHVELPTFSPSSKGPPPGPSDTEAWLAWLRGRTG